MRVWALGSVCKALDIAMEHESDVQNHTADL